jgi:hypothetical protein
MDDDWYRATVAGPNFTYSAGFGSEIHTSYEPAEAASPLGCLEQWQWCNSALSKENGCGPLAGKSQFLGNRQLPAPAVFGAVLQIHSQDMLRILPKRAKDMY